jgi:hypothetical protein
MTFHWWHRTGSMRCPLDVDLEAPAGFLSESKSREKKKRSLVATQFEQQTTSRPEFWGWFAPRYARSSSEFKVQTATTEGSEAEINLKTKLTGNVNFRLKSETFPLERMADIIQPKEITAKRIRAVAPRLCRRAAALPSPSPP